MEQQFTFSFTAQELEKILFGLNEMPHKFSRDLIDKITTEATLQKAKEPIDKKETKDE